MSEEDLRWSWLSPYEYRYLDDAGNVVEVTVPQTPSRDLQRKIQAERERIEKALGGLGTDIYGSDPETSSRLRSYEGEGTFFRKRIERVPGGYRVDGRLVQAVQKGLYAGGELGGIQSPEERLRQAFGSASKSIGDIHSLTRRQPVAPLAQRTGQAEFSTHLEPFPQIPTLWESEYEGTGGVWRHWPAALQARMFAGMQLQTKRGEHRDPGAWSGYWFPPDTGRWVSRGAETQPMGVRQHGRFLTFPIQSLAASSEVFADPLNPWGAMKAGFPAGKAAKRAQAGMHPLLPLEGVPVAESPFRKPKINVRNEMWQPPPEMGQPIYAAVLQSGLLPEGMGQVNLPPSYEERLVRRTIPGMKDVPRGTLLDPSGVPPAPTTAGRYQDLELGRTPEGLPITFGVNDWEGARLLEQWQVGHEGGVSLMSRIKQWVQTGMNMSMKAGGQKTYLVPGTLPGQLGRTMGLPIQALMNAPKNTVGEMHSILSGVRALEPEAWRVLKETFDLSDDWDTIEAERIMRAGQAYKKMHTQMVPIQLAMHEANFPYQQLAIEGGQVVAQDDFVGHLLGAERREGAEGVWNLTLAKPMYTGPILYQGRRESFGRRPFVSPEELQQISEFLSPGWAQQLRGQSGWQSESIARVWQAWEGRPGSSGRAASLGEAVPMMRMGERDPQYLKELETWRRQTAAAERRERRTRQPVERPARPVPTNVWDKIVMRQDQIMQQTGQTESEAWLEAMVEEIGDKPVEYIFGQSRKEQKRYTMPSPRDVMSFKAINELGEMVSPFVRAYTDLTSSYASDTKPRQRDRMFGDFSRAYKDLIGSASFQRSLAGAWPRHAVEGPMGADVALAPRQAVYGREALAQLAGLPMKRLHEEGIQAKLDVFERTVEKRWREKDPLIGFMLRRPISHAKAQMQMVAHEILTEKIGRELGVTAEGLGRGAVMSTQLAAAGRGDVDVDRFISLLAHQGPVVYQPRRMMKQRLSLRRGLEPDAMAAFGWPVTAKGGRMVFQGQEAMLPVPARWHIQTPEFARKMMAEDLPTQLRAHAREISGREDVWWNEMEKWRKEQADASRYENTMAAQGSLYNLLHEIDPSEIEGSYAKELLNRTIAMGINYNIARSNEMQGVDREAMLALGSTGYQYALDMMYGWGKEEGPEGFKTLMELWGSYIPRGDAGYYRKFHPYEEETRTHIKGMLKPQWQTMKGGPTKFAGTVMGALQSLVKGGSLQPEHAAALAYGSEYSEAQLSAIQKADPMSMVEAGGGIAALMQQPTLTRTIMSRRLHSQYSKGWRPGEGSAWHDVPWQEMVGEGGLHRRTIGFLSRGTEGAPHQMLPDVLRQWPYEDQWLAQDILRRSQIEAQTAAMGISSKWSGLGGVLQVPTLDDLQQLKPGMSAAEVEGHILAWVGNTEVMIPEQFHKQLKEVMETAEASGLSQEGFQFIERMKRAMGDVQGPSPASIGQAIRTPGGGYSLEGAVPQAQPAGAPGFSLFTFPRGGGGGLGNMSPDLLKDMVAEGTFEGIVKAQETAREAERVSRETRSSHDTGDMELLKTWVQAFRGAQGGWTSAEAEYAAIELGHKEVGQFGSMQRFARSQQVPIEELTDDQLARRQSDLVSMGGFLERKKHVIPEELRQEQVAGVAERMRREQAAASQSTWQDSQPSQEYMQVYKAMMNEVLGSTQDLQAARQVWQQLGSDEHAQLAKDFNYNLKDLNNYMSNARQAWAAGVVSGPQADIAISNIEEAIANRAPSTATRAQLGALMQFREEARDPRATPEAQARGQKVDEVAEAYSRMEQERLLETPRQGRIRTTMENLLSEFSIGGAAIRAAVIGRYTTGAISQWQQQAVPLQAAGMQFGMAMGLPAQQALTGPMGQMQQYQAGISSMQMARGEQVLRARAGLAGFAGTALGLEPGAELGSVLGQVLGPVQGGLGMAGIAGVVSTSAGNILEKSGGARMAAAGTGLIAASPWLALGAGALYAGAQGLGALWEAGEPSSLQRQWAEVSMGERKDVAPWSKMGALLQYQVKERGILDTLQQMGPGGSGIRFEDAWAAAKQLGQARKEYEASEAFQVERASIYIQNLEGLGLDTAQTQQLGPLLNMVGYGAGDILSGRADEMARELAPMVRLGEQQQYVTALTQLGANLGYAPGPMIESFAGQMPTMSQPSEQARWQIASQFLGGLGQQTRTLITEEQVERYAGMMEYMPTWQAQSLAMREMGVTGLESMYGYRAGTGQQGAFAAGFYSGYTPVDMPQEAAQIMSRVPGLQALPLPAEQQGAFAKALTSAIQGGGDVSGVLSSMLNLANPDQGLQAGWDQTPMMGMAAAQMASQIAQGGAWGQPGYTGTAMRFGNQAAQMMLDQGPGATNWMLQGQQDLQAIASESGWGAGRRDTEMMNYMRFAPEVGRGAYMTTVNQRRGYGLIQQALGIPGGMGQGVEGVSMQQLLSDELTMEQYTQRATLIGLGQDRVGYSMATGAFGLGGDIQRARREAGLERLEGTPLLEYTDQGVYGIGQLEQRAATWDYMRQQQDKTLGRGRWATQTVDTRLGRGPQTYQMGLAGDIQMAREGMATTMALQGLQQRAADLSYGWQMQQIGTQRAQLGMQFGQSMRSLDLRQQMWQVNSDFTRQQFGWQQQAMDQQRTWGREDMATAGQIAGLRMQAFEANVASQRSGLDFARRSASMQYRQALESLGLQERMWGAQTAFQRQQMGWQWEGMQQQREWGREDIALQSQVAGLQYGWQMEDLDRNIRFATGRQKEQLIRQRGRAEEMFSIQEGQRATQSERQEEVWKQEEEQFAARKAHFEEIKELEQENFDMRKRHLAESYALQMEQLQSQEDHLAKSAGIQREIMQLQEAQRLRQNERQETLWAQEEEQFAAKVAHFEEINALEQTQFDNQRQDLIDNYQFQLDKLIEQEEHLTTMKDLEDEIRTIQNDRTLKQQEHNIAQLEWNESFYTETVFPHQEEMQRLQDQTQDAEAEYQKMIIDAMSKGGTVWTAYEQLFDAIESWAHMIKGIMGQGGGGGGAGGGDAGVGGYWVCKAIRAETGNTCNSTNMPERTTCQTCGAPKGHSGQWPPGGIQVDSVVPTYADILTGQAAPVSGNSSSVVVNGVTITVSGAGDPQAVAQAVADQFEAKLNDIAARQRQRGSVWD